MSVPSSRRLKRPPARSARTRYQQFTAKPMASIAASGQRNAFSGSVTGGRIMLNAVDYLVTCTSALVIAILTLFSGFGLGTLLMPVFAVFFPAEVAVAATAVVHLANNLFKLLLVGRHAAWLVVLAFGLPAVPAAIGGAAVLEMLAQAAPVATWTLAGRHCEVTQVK